MLVLVVVVPMVLLLLSLLLMLWRRRWWVEVRMGVAEEGRVRCRRYPQFGSEAEVGKVETSWRIIEKD